MPNIQALALYHARSNDCNYVPILKICAATLGVGKLSVKPTDSPKTTSCAKHTLAPNVQCVNAPPRPLDYDLEGHMIRLLQLLSQQPSHPRTGGSIHLTYRSYTPVTRIVLLGLVLLSLGACSGSGAGATAFIGASVFDGSGTPPILDAVIIVRDGVIEAIGSEADVRVPRGAQEFRLDGSWVIPGLIDSHAHPSSWTLTRFLAYGVTSVRGMGGDQESIVALRDSVSIGSLLGPRLFISGAMIDGSPATWSNATSVSSQSEARQAVDTRVLIEAAQVKIYTKINRELLEAIGDEASALQIPIAAHLGKVDAITAARMGVHSLEHMTGVVEATMLDPTRLLRAHSNFFAGWKAAGRAWANLDSAGLDATATTLVEAGTVIVPTLVQYETYGHLADDEYISTLDLEGVPQAVRDDWNIPDLIRRAQLTQSDYRMFRRSRPAQDLFIRLYRSHNGTVVAGTDAPAQLLAPGASLHDELALLVAAGLSPREAILSATRHAAELIEADTVGVLAPGNVADFVVLAGNPLEDIHNTRTVERVVFKGASYHPDELRLDWR